MSYEHHEDPLMDCVATLDMILAGPVDPHDDDDGMVAVRVPAPQRPDPQDSAVAVPEPDEESCD